MRQKSRRRKKIKNEEKIKKETVIKNEIKIKNVLIIKETKKLCNLLRQKKITQPFGTKNHATSQDNKITRALRTKN